MSGDREGLLILAEGSIGRALAMTEAGGLELLGEIMGLLADLPALDMPALHGFGDRLARRDAEATWRMAMQLWLWWLARITRAGVTAPMALAGGEIVPGEARIAGDVITRAGLESLVRVWEKTAALIARAEGANLDRKQVVIGVFGQLQTVMRR